jgi:hypothetical protein
VRLYIGARYEAESGASHRGVGVIDQRAPERTQRRRRIRIGSSGVQYLVGVRREIGNRLERRRLCLYVGARYETKSRPCDRGVGVVDQ